MSGALDGRVVTGAGRGIEASVSRLFAERSALRPLADGLHPSIFMRQVPK
jgi:hypothetical protein